ncbi:MAG: T9SS type A sorting domain-containing protein [Candidatus Eisenbacteria bacterium]|nr:T9SS type A sorting domain-containing protein [Candidatus Eisenbacteria bacterium]
MRKFIAVVALLLVTSSTVHAQVGSLLWEDNFNNLDHWLKVTGNGSWGWGNGELEFYRNENVDIAPVPGEAGNNALRIIARNESGPGIVDQWGNPLNYTSGKVVTKSFVSVQYGMIEARVQVPNLNLGGWPAVWMLGTATSNWPNCGEVDLMEMGAGKAFRDLHDTHNGGNGLNNSTVNQMVGANAIYYSPASVNPGNPAGVASLAYDPSDVYDRPYYNYASPLVARFLLYRLYWDENSMRFTVVDNGVEHDLYAAPFVLGPDSDEFRQPFYLLANLAIGGAYTDAYRLGDTGSGLPISMPLPATMYVDYVRVYQWNGQGEVTLGPPAARDGRFGLFTDNTPTSASLETGVTSDIFVWESTLVNGSTPPFEGANGLAWTTNAKGWFGAGVMSRQPTNLFNFGDGFLKFRIKIPANVTFKIGVIDVWGNQYYVQLPANQTKYGLVRNGQWGQVTIPVTDLRGPAIDLRMLSYEFVILEEGGAACTFALDDIYWERAVVTGVEGAEVAPRAPSQLTSMPNPFVGSTELRFALTQPAPYELTVFDAAGKRVTEFRGIGRAGANAVRWNGRDHDGRSAKPGVYWYQLVSGGRSESRKVVLLQ